MTIWIIEIIQSQPFMFLKWTTFILVLLCAPVVGWAASQADRERYDGEEAIRRLVEKAQEEEKREREAAKQRYDDKYGSGSSSGSDCGVGICCTIPSIIFLIWLSSWFYGEFVGKKED